MGAEVERGEVEVHREGVVDLEIGEEEVRVGEASVQEAAQGHEETQDRVADFVVEDDILAGAESRSSGAGGKTIGLLVVCTLLPDTIKNIIKKQVQHTCSIR